MTNVEWTDPTSIRHSLFVISGGPKKKAAGETCG